MLKSGQNRPISSGKVTKILKDDEWRRFENEVTLSANEDGCLNFSVDGGSDNGQFACISELVQSKVNYKSGTLNEGDIILEVQGQKVAGYTQRDVVAWLNHCCKNGNPVVLKTISPGKVNFRHSIFLRLIKKCNLRFFPPRLIYTFQINLNFAF